MNVKVNLKPLIGNINLPTVLKTAILPGGYDEGLFVATQIGEIFYIENNNKWTFLDIRPLVLELGTSNGGYDERGLLGLAFNPEFHYKGIFYLHYSVAGTQGPGALPGSYEPNPCDTNTLNLEWINRETQFDHIDTIEEWVLDSSGHSQKRRTLLNIRRPFMNHNGVNSLNISPETGKLVLTTGDGGSGYDPFNLSQNIMEIAGKIIEIDTSKNISFDNPPVVTRFDELPLSIRETLTIIGKGVRNTAGITYLNSYGQYIKCLGNVGQELEESIYAFTNYKAVPATQIVQSNLTESEPEQAKECINIGWRGWEGSFPTLKVSNCSKNPELSEKVVSYYNEAIETAVCRLKPICTYFHEDHRPNKFSGTALTGVHPYMGTDIPNLTGSLLFTDFAQQGEPNLPVRGALAYTRVRADLSINDYSIIEINYDFGSKSSYYVSLGTNMDQSKIYLGVYGSSNVTDYNQGTVFEIIP
jgi:hypothetical protein